MNQKLARESTEQGEFGRLWPSIEEAISTIKDEGAAKVPRWGQQRTGATP